MKGCDFMTKAEFEKLLEEACKLYLIKENQRQTELDKDDNVPFSEEHKQKMKELFEKIRKKEEEKKRKNCRK